MGIHTPRCRFSWLSYFLDLALVDLIESNTRKKSLDSQYVDTDRLVDG